MAGEFDLIERWFRWSSTPQVEVGVGDDAAVLQLMPSQNLVSSTKNVISSQRQLVSVDTFIVGTHCPPETSAHAIGFKALAVNISDMAAMGAKPAWFTLALSLPSYDEQWLDDFVAGMKSLADHYNIALVGGDTTKGALSITINIVGYAEQNQILLRSKAKVGDKLYVTGKLGKGALGLKAWQQGMSQHFTASRRHLDYPVPRVEHGLLLAQYASACIDLSDGLVADLGHILKASHVGANLHLSHLPMADELVDGLANKLQGLDAEQALSLALLGGDDYELLYTVSAEQEQAMLAALLATDLPCYYLGEITDKIGVITFDGQPYEAVLPSLATKGYDHFGD